MSTLLNICSISNVYSTNCRNSINQMNKNWQFCHILYIIIFFITLSIFTNTKQTPTLRDSSTNICLFSILVVNIYYLTSTLSFSSYLLFSSLFSIHLISKVPNRYSDQPSPFFSLLTIHQINFVFTLVSCSTVNPYS